MADKSINPKVLVHKFKRGLQKKTGPEEAPEEKREAVRPPVAYPLPYPSQSKPEEAEKEPEVKPEQGIEIGIEPQRLGKPLTFEEEDKERISIYYPLVPPRPKKGETVFAYAYITFDPRRKEFVYQVLEPRINQLDRENVGKIKRRLEERLDIDIDKLGTVKAKEILKKEIDQVISSIGLDVGGRRKRTLTYYIERDTLGLGKLQPLMNDPNVEDISCDGVGIPLYVYHRDPRIGSVKTNVTFDTKDELDSFITKLAQKCNKSISVAEPLLDGTLPDGSRVQATLGTDIARRGSNLTIRKFTEIPLTPTHMLRYGTLNPLQLAYLWLAVENGKSILVSGGTATGKTSLLNVLSLFIKPNLKVVSIEDTPELRLPLTHWVPHVARSALSEKGKIGEVTLFDLLKSSLRQRPDYIILGEVRGKEAFVLFQQMATGHSSLATIHAASIPQLVDRLTTPPISLPAKLLENIDIIVFLVLSKVKGSEVRRTDNILEVTGVEDEEPVTRNIFQWRPSDDSFQSKNKSTVLEEIARRSGVEEEEVRKELFRRKKVLEWMEEREMYDYKDVARVVQAYYADPERVMDAVEESI